MNDKPLLEYPAKELLNKFGKGSHKPGSGSAAALQAMLSSQLIHTVITITNEDKYKQRYEKVLGELLIIDNKLMKRIYPSLENLFQNDAILFDKVIQLRRERDNEKENEARRNYLDAQSQAALRPATDILIKIGDHCADVADFAVYVFDNGFKSAKGDSGVALKGAIAALGGCLSIIDLNLSLLGSDEWTATIREKVEELRIDYNNLEEEAKKRMNTFTNESLTRSFERAKKDLCSGRWEGVRVTEDTIESIAEQMQNLLWDFRSLLWGKDIPSSRYQVLKPEMVIEKIFQYKFGYAELGHYQEDGIAFQIAGQINRKEKQVVISKQLNQEVRNFTIAHELAHILFHNDMTTMHRDFPLDGSLVESRDIREIEANKFASCFLMPANTVKNIFIQAFAMNKFVINEETIFKFTRFKSINEFNNIYRNRRNRSRFLAKLNYEGFQSLHKVFGVSVEAMAIRLEKLGLIE